MSQMTIDPRELQSAIQDIMKAFQVEAEEVMEDTAWEVAQECAKRLKVVSPKGHSRKHYANGWRAKKLTFGRGKKYWQTVVYNATKPGLAHLLEHGHNGARANGTAYYVPAQVHIKPVEEEFVREYEKKVRDRLEHLK